MCLVLPSYTESFPMVILEAMSMGVPVVATPLGGIPTLVRDGENGILVPPGDPHALARAIMMIVESEATRQFMGRNAHARAGRYAWPIVARTLIDEIRSVLKGKATVERTRA